MANSIINCINGNITNLLVKQKLSRELTKQATHQSQVSFVELKIKELEERKARVEKLILKAEPKSISKTIASTTLKGLMASIPGAVLAKNALQQYYDFSAALKKAFKEEAFKAFADKHLQPRSSGIDSESLLRNISKHIDPFVDEVNALFTNKTNPDFYFEDGLQYLKDDTTGLLKPQIAQAIALGAYKWQATFAERTLINDNKAASAILSLTQDVPHSVWEQLAELGNTQRSTIDQLGQLIYPLLGLNVTTEAEVTFAERLKVSLGSMALATMESQGVIVKTRVLSGQNIITTTYKDKTKAPLVKIVDTNVGISHLRNVAKGEVKAHGNTIIHPLNQGINIPKKDKSITEVIGITNFYRVAVDNTNNTIVTKAKSNDKGYRDASKDIVKTKNISKTEAIASVKEKKVLYDAADDTWGDLFGTHDPKPYSFEPSEITEEPMQIGDTNQVSSKRQSKNQSKYNQNAYAPVRAIFDVIGKLGEDSLLSILGFKNELDMAKEHITEQLGARSRNLDIKRTLESIQNYSQKALNHTGDFNTNTPIYIMSSFLVHGRAMMNPGMSLQGDKRIRHSFVNPKMTTQFNPLESSKEYKYFMMAIGKVFGHEISKLGWISRVIKRAENELANPDIIAVVEVLQKMIAKPNTTIANFDAILEKALKGREEPIAILHGLTEFARFQNAIEANKTEFDTTMMLEVDGLSNGPMIFLLNFITDNVSMPDIFKHMRNAGWIFDPEQPAIEQMLTHNANHDIYKTMSFAWYKALQARISVLTAQEAQSTLDKINAVTTLVGALGNEDSLVAKAMRNLAKDPTIQSVFGASPKGLGVHFVHDTIIQKGIHQKLAKIANMSTSTELEIADFFLAINNLNTTVETLTGNILVNTHNVKIPVLKQAMLKRKMNTEETNSILDHVKDNHGKALGEGVEAVYGDAMKARSKLNNGLQFATAFYNEFHTRMVTQAEQAKADELGIDIEKVTLTNGEYAEITEKLKKAIPMLRTPFYKDKAQGGFIELAKPNTDPDYRIEKTNNYTRIYYKEIEGKKKITRKRQTLSTLQGLEDPGVRGVILSIHNFDAAIANVISGMDAAILNVYDGFYAGLKDIDQVATEVNTILIEFARDYDIAFELSEATKRSFAATTGIAKELGFTKAELGVMEDAALRKAFEKLIKNTDETTGMRDKLFGEMTAIGQQTLKNKRTLINAAHGVNHYNWTGGGATNNLQSGDAHALSKGSLNKYETVKEDDDRSDPRKYGSKAEEEMAGNPDHYENVGIIDRSNVVDTYNALKDTGPAETKDTPEHDSHLQRLLSTIMENVLNPLTLYGKVTSTDETHGLFRPDINAVFLDVQTNNIAATGSSILNNGIRRSTGTIYVHELLHAVLDAGLQTDSTAVRQLKALFHEVKENLGVDGYKVFLNDPTIDVTDVANAIEVQAAKDRYDHIFNNKEALVFSSNNTVSGNIQTLEYTNSLAEFAAMGMTDVNFFNKLASMQISNKRQKIFAKNSWTSIRGANIQETFINLISRIMSILKNNINTHRDSTNVAQVLENLTRQIAGLDQKNKSRFYKILEKESVLASAAGKRVNKFVSEKFVKWPVTRTIAAAHTVGQVIDSKDYAGFKTMRGWINKWHSLEAGLAQAIVSEVTHGNETIRPIYDLLVKREIILDGAQMQLIQANISAYRKAFTRDLSKEEKVLLGKFGIKTDMSALTGAFTLDEIAAMLEDSSKLNAHITKIKNELQSTPAFKKNFNHYNKEADALAYFMVHGEGTEGAQNLHNVKLIVSMLNTNQKNTLNVAETQKAEQLVDQLISLYAIGFTAIKGRKQLAALIKEEPVGIEYVLNAHKELQVDAASHLFKNDPFKMQKGYTKSITNPYNEITTGTDEDHAHLISRGYKRIGQPLGRDKTDKKSRAKTYLYVSKGTGRAGSYVHGGMSFTTDRAKGTGLAELGFTPAEFNKIKQAKQSTANATLAKNPVRHSNVLIPKVNAKGEVIEYRYIMSEHTKDTSLDQTNQFDITLSATRGSLLNKQVTPDVNKTMIDTLHAIYKEDHKRYPDAYVEISAYSKDPELRDYYHMMPTAAKEHVKRVWGSNLMLVRKDALAAVFGYRKYSILQAFDKSPADRKFLEKLVLFMAKTFTGKYAYRILNGLETSAIAATTMAKTNIVVRNISVTGGNYVSNIMYLRTKGIPNGEIWTKSQEAWKSGLKYQADKLNLQEAKISLGLLQKAKVKDTQKIAELRTKILEFGTDMKNNPTREFIESGGMPDMVDDYDTAGGVKELYQNNLEKKLDKVSNVIGSKSKKAQNVANSLFLTQDREGFKILNNAVKMTDFVARYVLYRHYTDVARGDNVQTHKDAMRAVQDELINFSIPTHKILQYGNDIGTIWFSKYQLRVLKVMATSMAHKPFETLYNIMLSNMTGAANIFFSIPGVSKDAFQGFGDAYSGLSGSVPNILPLQVTGEVMDTFK